MKKFLKRFMVVFLTISILATNNIAILATQVEDDQISPRYTNTEMCSLAFTVVAPGEAHINITYNGISGVFREARATVKIQKRFLLIFWNTVDIGLPNNEWTATSTDREGYFYNCFDVDGTGTYRAIFTVEIIGTDGSVDLIEETREDKYS